MTNRCLFGFGGLAGVLVILAALLLALYDHGRAHIGPGSVRR